MDADPVGFFDDVAVGEDVAFGIDKDAGAQRTLPDRPRIGATLTALAALATEEAVEEVVEGAAIGVGVVVVISGGASQVAVRILHRALGINVDDGRLKLLGNLRKGIGELLRGGNAERGRVARLGVFLALKMTSSGELPMCSL